jgi:glycosyltransferase involved in cell wall biosynthesis
VRLERRLVKRVLMVAYHYPPQSGSSGVQRTLRFADYLPEFGWEPIVLTASRRAYERSEPGSADPPHVHRAFALDAARHLGVGGRYLRASALPDRWSSWWLGAVPLGLRLARRYGADAIWSTYPIATAHMIGRSLQSASGLPWVADFRDPMLEADYPADPAVRRAFARVEGGAIAHSAAAVFTTPGARDAFAGKYPLADAARFHVIENGYDEDAFARAESAPDVRGGDAPFTLLHSGIVYPSERDPRALFGALAMLRARGVIAAGSFRLALRAPVHEAALRPLLAQAGVDDLVDLLPPLPYEQALREMLAADALLVLQAANCNQQIPAKLYEYMRARRPILALTDPAGDTARALHGIAALAPLDNQEAIAAALERFLADVRGALAPVPALERVRAHTRHARTRELASLLDAVTAR